MTVCEHGPFGAERFNGYRGGHDRRVVWGGEFSARGTLHQRQFSEDHLEESDGDSDIPSQSSAYRSLTCRLTGTQLRGPLCLTEGRSNDQGGLEIPRKHVGNFMDEPYFHRQLEGDTGCSLFSDPDSTADLLPVVELCDEPVNTVRTHMKHVWLTGIVLEDQLSAELLGSPFRKGDLGENGVFAVLPHFVDFTELAVRNKQPGDTSVDTQVEEACSGNVCVPIVGGVDQWSIVLDEEVLIGLIVVCLSVSHGERVWCVVSLLCL